MSKPGKNRRIEEQFDESQRRTMLYLMDKGYGIEAVQERFGLTEEAAMEYIIAGRAELRAKERTGTDWAKRYAEFML